MFETPIVALAERRVADLHPVVLRGFDPAYWGLNQPPPSALACIHSIQDSHVYIRYTRVIAGRRVAD